MPLTARGLATRKSMEGRAFRSIHAAIVLLTAVEPAAKQALLNQLDVSAGKLAHVRRMVEDGRKVIDILEHTRAVEQALRQFDAAMLATHLATMARPGPLERREALPIQELCELFERSRRRRLGSGRRAQ